MIMYHPFAAISLVFLLISPIAAVYDNDTEVSLSVGGHLLLNALKRVILNAGPKELLKNLSRITFYRHTPTPQTQVINLGTDQNPEEMEVEQPEEDGDENVKKYKNESLTSNNNDISQPQPQPQPQHQSSSSSSFYATFVPSNALQQSAPPPCAQPQQVGNGPYRIPRWFFNRSSARCEPFYWSGCCGNANNFASRPLCERACEGTAATSRTSGNLPKSPSTLIYAPVSLSVSMPRSPPQLLPARKPQPPLVFTPPPIAVTSTATTPILATSTANPALMPTDPASFPSPSGTPPTELLEHPQFPVVDDKRNSVKTEEEWPEDADEEAGDERWRPVALPMLHPAGRNWTTRSATKSPAPPMMANPCSHGSGTAQFMFCKPTASATCPGQQFCHVGDSPVTTVCCNKPAALDACQQPLTQGVGRSSLQRWFYFAPTAQCQSFVYRGLQGNENNFLSRADCEQICQVNPCAAGSPLRDPHSGQLGYCSAQQQGGCPAGFYCHVGGDAPTSVCCPALAGDPCSQPVNSGTGFYQLPRWYHDSATGQCRPFTYCGMRGTQNNFLSREECEQRCAPGPCRLPLPPDARLQQCTPGPGACDGRPDLYCHVGASPATTVCCPAEPLDRCVQPVEPGVGPDQLQRFAYDAQAQQCMPFAYRGLQGNQNNFLSQEECELACLPNPCPTGTPFVGADGRIQGCAVSTASMMSTCPRNYWCHVGANTATTVCCPDANPNPCQLPMSTGDGPYQLSRFYYDSASRTCKPFTYKGLKGNQNNFLSMRACQLACLPLDNPCIGQPARSGSGQVFFCSATNRDICPVNFWCHLGAIPETTVCCPGATNPCSVPLSPGTGNAGLARWYYNADERQCVAFQYNGKRGNQNNFLSQDECQHTCPAQLCLLSIDRGSCSGRQTRYAFDRQKSQCVPFDYSGCGGNLNNFLTMQECQQVCGDLI